MEAFSSVCSLINGRESMDLDVPFMELFPDDVSFLPEVLVQPQIDATQCSPLYNNNQTNIISEGQEPLENIVCVICGGTLTTVYKYHKHNIKDHSSIQLSEAVLKLRNLHLPSNDIFNSDNMNDSDCDDSHLFSTPFYDDIFSRDIFNFRPDGLDEEVIELGPTESSDILRIQSRLVKNSDKLSQKKREVIEVKENKLFSCPKVVDPNSVVVKFSNLDSVQKESQLKIKKESSPLKGLNNSNIEWPSKQIKKSCVKSEEAPCLPNVVESENTTTLKEESIIIPNETDPKATEEKKTRSGRVSRKSNNNDCFVYFDESMIDDISKKANKKMKKKECDPVKSGPNENIPPEPVLFVASNGVAGNNCNISSENSNSSPVANQLSISSSESPSVIVSSNKQSSILNTNTIVVNNINVKTKKYQCHICYKQYNKNVNYTNHMKKYHHDTQWMKYKCTKCDSSFGYLAVLQKHMKEHNPKLKFSCEYCGKNFKTLVNLKNHISSHTKDKIYSCTECPKKYYLKGSYRKHLKTHTVDSKYYCKQCDRGFIEKYPYTQHLNQHQFGSNLGRSKNLKCNYCGDIKTNKELSTVNKNDSGYHKTCNICHKGLYKRYLVNNVPSEVKVTEKSTNNKIRQECTDCNKKVIDLKRHFKTVHQNDRYTTCDICNIVISRASLASHRNRKHGGKNVKCDHCDKFFKNSLSLREHINIIKQKNEYMFCFVCKHVVVSNNWSEHVKCHKVNRSPA